MCPDLLHPIFTILQSTTACFHPSNWNLKRSLNVFYNFLFQPVLSWSTMSTSSSVIHDLQQALLILHINIYFFSWDTNEFLGLRSGFCPLTTPSNYYYNLVQFFIITLNVPHINYQVLPPSFYEVTHDYYGSCFYGFLRLV